jgi:PAS domain S-box-containing protein
VIARPAGTRFIQLQRRPSRQRGPLRPGDPHWGWRYLAAAALVLATAAASAYGPELLALAAPFFAYFPAVVLAGFIGGLGPGLAATALAALTSSYLNFSPPGSLAVSEPLDQLRLALFLSMGALLSWAAHVLHGSVRLYRDAQSASERGKEQLALVTDMMPGLVSYIGADHRYVFGNAAYRDWFGAREVAGRHMSEVLGARAYERVRPRVEEALSGRTVLYEARLPYASGERWVEARYVPDRGPDGKVRGVVALVLDVTQRRGAEAARAESERKYRDLFETMDEGFCVIEPVYEGDRAVDYRFLEINPAFKRQTGLEDAEGRTMRELAPKHEQFWFDVYGRVGLTGEPARFEHGAAELGRWYEVHAWRYRESPRQVAVLFKDVKERKEADAARLASERKFRLLFDSMDEGFCVIQLLFEGGKAADFRFVEVNPAFTRQSGLSSPVGKTIRQIQPGLEPFWIETYARVALTGVTERFEAEASPLGRWFEVHAWRFGDAKARQVAVLFNDISERRSAQAAVVRGERRLRTIIDEMNMLISYVGNDLRYVFNNRRYLDWFGKDPDALKGTHVRDLLPPPAFERARPYLERALAGDTVSFETEAALRGERRHLRVEYVPERGEDGKVRGFFTFVTDVTEGRRRAQELQKAVDERTEALRRTVEDLEAFSYTVSHDLRAPLRAIQGYASIIAKRVDGRLGADTQGLLERINLSATRMDTLIQDLLAFGRLSRSDYRMYALEVEPVVDHILAQYPGFEQAAVTVKRPLGRVIGQDSLLTQVLSNLLGNALKFVPKGRVPRIELGVERGGGRARVVVADNGVGLTAEERARLFRPFTRLHSAAEFEGTGIGLAIVKKAAERMGGAVGVESEPGVGSRFWVELPDAGRD